MGEKIKKADPKKPASKSPETPQTRPHTFVVTDRNGCEQRYKAYSVSSDWRELVLKDSEEAIVAIISGGAWVSVHRAK